MNSAEFGICRRVEHYTAKIFRTSLILSSRPMIGIQCMGFTPRTSHDRSWIICSNCFGIIYSVTPVGKMEFFNTASSLVSPPLHPASPSSMFEIIQEERGAVCRKEMEGDLDFWLTRKFQNKKSR